MNVLEKILEEIKETKEVSQPQSLINPLVGGIIIGLTMAEEIVRMFTENLKNNVDANKTIEWIPVTERLPEDIDEQVLITVNGKYKSVEFQDAIMLGDYSHRFKDWVIEGWEEWRNPNVVAWMPLPEAYKGE